MEQQNRNITTQVQCYGITVIVDKAFNPSDRRWIDAEKNTKTLIIMFFDILERIHTLKMKGKDGNMVTYDGNKMRFLIKKFKNVNGMRAYQCCVEFDNKDEAALMTSAISDYSQYLMDLGIRENDPKNKKKEMISTEGAKTAIHQYKLMFDPQSIIESVHTEFMGWSVLGFNRLFNVTTADAILLKNEFTMIPDEEPEILRHFYCKLQLMKILPHFQKKETAIVNQLIAIDETNPDENHGEFDFENVKSEYVQKMNYSNSIWNVDGLIYISALLRNKEKDRKNRFKSIENLNDYQKYTNMMKSRRKELLEIIKIIFAPDLPNELKKRFEPAFVSCLEHMGEKRYKGEIRLFHHISTDKDGSKNLRCTNFELGDKEISNWEISFFQFHTEDSLYIKKDYASIFQTMTWASYLQFMYGKILLWLEGRSTSGKSFLSEQKMRISNVNTCFNVDNRTLNSFYVEVGKQGGAWAIIDEAMDALFNSKNKGDSAKEEARQFKLMMTQPYMSKNCFKYIDINGKNVRSQVNLFVQVSAAGNCNSNTLIDFAPDYIKSRTIPLVVDTVNVLKTMESMVNEKLNLKVGNVKSSDFCEFQKDMQSAMALTKKASVIYAQKPTEDLLGWLLIHHILIFLQGKGLQLPTIRNATTILNLINQFTDTGSWMKLCAFKDKSKYYAKPFDMEWVLEANEDQYTKLGNVVTGICLAQHSLSDERFEFIKKFLFIQQLNAKAHVESFYSVLGIKDLGDWKIGYDYHLYAILDAMQKKNGKTVQFTFKEVHDGTKVLYDLNTIVWHFENFDKCVEKIQECNPNCLYGPKYIIKFLKDLCEKIKVTRTKSLKFVDKNVFDKNKNWIYTLDNVSTGNHKAVGDTIKLDLIKVDAETLGVTQEQIDDLECRFVKCNVDESQHPSNNGSFPLKTMEMDAFKLVSNDGKLALEIELELLRNESDEHIIESIKSLSKFMMADREFILPLKSGMRKLKVEADPNNKKTRTIKIDVCKYFTAYPENAEEFGFNKLKEDDILDREPPTRDTNSTIGDGMVIDHNNEHYYTKSYYLDRIIQTKNVLVIFDEEAEEFFGDTHKEEIGTKSIQDMKGKNYEKYNEAIKEINGKIKRELDYAKFKNSNLVDELRKKEDELCEQIRMVKSKQNELEAIRQRNVQKQIEDEKKEEEEQIMEEKKRKTEREIELFRKRKMREFDGLSRGLDDSTNIISELFGEELKEMESSQSEQNDSKSHIGVQNDSPKPTGFLDKSVQNRMESLQVPRKELELMDLSDNISDVPTVTKKKKLIKKKKNKNI